ncbi:L10-interacting MYB domain-containing protein-like [Tasmannia lanceolata]|uniref:L10-interacting MYB domain-containing protein-like n=1 Tax=Tasmannia lanceolata TaxID=3420 RepID=UPI0040648F9D
MDSQQGNPTPSLPQVVSSRKGKQVSSARPIRKAVWDSNKHTIFIDLCLEQVNKGERPSTHLTIKGWEAVLDGFESQTGVRYERNQLKNHWDNTKYSWKAWHELLNNTELGWDHQKATVIADDEFWTNFAKVFKDCP